MIMQSSLQVENYSLRQQLENLLHEARENERKMRRLDQLERQLIASNSLVDLIRLLLCDYRQAFGIEYVTLTLVDREYETHRTLEVEGNLTSNFPGLQLVQSSTLLEEMYSGTFFPRLGEFSARQHGNLFSANNGSIASVALLPLTRQGELIGSLHLGSADPERYHAEAGTQFLERLSQIIAICLESAQTRERIKLAGLTDGLTGVQNRRYFDHRQQIEIGQARRQKQTLACMFIDIDRFKRINDTFGHQAGDEILRTVAKLVQSQLRSSDTVARYGGEEFVVLLPQTAGHYALEIAERIRHTVADATITYAKQRVPTTISIGLALLPGDAENAQELGESLISRADQSLYQAKHNGRNQVVHDSIGFSRSTGKTGLKRLRHVVRQLSQALPAQLSRYVRI